MRSSNRRFIIGLVVAVLLLALLVVVFYLSRRPPSTVGSPTPLPAGQTYNSPADMPKPKPIANTFHGCPGSGDGGDPILNTNKNRIDEASWYPLPLTTVLSLTWPQSIQRHPHFQWSPADAQAIAQDEGAPVQIEGYLAAAKKQGPESCNCHSVSDVDYHIWVVGDPSQTRGQALVAEVTPRVQAFHPGWTNAALQRIVNSKQKVRLSGWLMMDPEHPEALGKTRASLWEVHPIMQIETFSGGKWTPLDNGTTGVSSSPLAARTVPPVTPVDTATVPPVSNIAVQHNETVQITALNYNGQKGNTEPDEYVEITNQGTQPVDMTGWTLEDVTGTDSYKWEDFVLQPGQRIRVYSNEVHPETGGFTFGSGHAVWPNKGGIAQLYDADGQVVSRFAYGNQK